MMSEQIEKIVAQMREVVADESGYGEPLKYSISMIDSWADSIEQALAAKEAENELLWQFSREYICDCDTTNIEPDYHDEICDWRFFIRDVAALKDTEAEGE